MSSDSPQSPRQLPPRPNLRHLKDQAKDLLRLGQAKSLASALFQTAREYGFASWPKLKANVESLLETGRLKAAIDSDDLPVIREMMSRNPALHCAPIGYNKNGPLTWAAECRYAAPSPRRLEIAKWMIENGSDIHQGGDGPLMRAALDDERIPMMELLVDQGADVNARWDGHYPILFAPCETLAPLSLRWLIAHGADMGVSSNDGNDCIQMLIGTYSRNAEGKHACLEVFADAGFPLPETAPMAVHRGRIDLLDECLDREPAMRDRRLAHPEIYPGNVGVRGGLTAVPVDGGTLLHVAIEYHEERVAQRLISRGADVNARSTVDSDGFGGHTPLFHCVVTMGPKDDSLARLLLQSGADPNLRATFRKQLVDMGDPEKEKMREYHDVTAIGFAKAYQEPGWVNEQAIAAIREFGGR